MRQITLRGIPDEIENMLKKEARKKGISLNRAFISFLEKAAGTKGKERHKKIYYHDLDHLSGIWTEEEGEIFTTLLDSQRQIDEELWKKSE